MAAKHIYSTCIMPLILACPIVSFAINPPTLKISAQCLDVKASWNKIDNATGYELWYQPVAGPKIWEHLDQGADKSEFAISLWEGAKYHVALMSYNTQERSSFSATKFLATGNFLLPPNPQLLINGLNVTLSWTAIAQAEGYELWYSLNAGDTWNQLSLDKSKLSFTVDLWSGAYVQVALKSIAGEGQASRFSEVLEVITGDNLPQVTTKFVDPLVNNKITEVFPAVTNSPYAAVLKDCVYAKVLAQSCLLNQLPLLGQEVDIPSIDNIMARTLVSHPWMAERFRQFLQQLPVDALRLFRAITAVVIASDIRPAAYMPSTGAIYLDAKNFLIQSDTPEIVNTVSAAPDSRAACGDALNYEYLFRYVKNEDVAYHTQLSERSLEDIVYLAGRVVLHELAHANDYFPPATLKNLSRELSVNVAARLNIAHRISLQSMQQFPLASDLLKYQGDIRYHCTDATCEQTGLTAKQITAEFATDIANDLYAYSNAREDLAMLAEESMMHYFLGVDRDVGIADLDFRVQWGQRRRITTANIKDKAKFIMRRLLPELDFVHYLDQLPLPISMRAGESWGANLNLDVNHKIQRHRNGHGEMPERFLPYR